MKKALIILFICYGVTGLCQNQLIVSKVKTDSSTIITYINERGDYNGFEKINDTTYQLIDIDKPCESGNPVMIDGVQTFESLPCFRDYILEKSKTDNKIVAWGNLEVEEQKNIINAWEQRVNYTGSWSIRGETSACKCAYSNTPGDYLTFSFYGTGIKVISEKVPTHGISDVYLDGELVETINLNSNVTINPFTAYEVNGLISGLHTVKIEVKSDGYFLVRKFEVIDEPNLPEAEIDTVYVEKIIYDTVYVDKVKYDTLQPKFYIKADEFEFEIK